MPSENELMIGRLATLEANDKKHDDDIKSIINDIKDIKDNLLQRPSWAVSIIISILLAVCSSLVIYVATNVK